MKINIPKVLVAIAIATATLTACNKDSELPKNSGNFILTVTPAASTGVADYLLTSSSLDTGRISTSRNGVEQDGTYRYYVTHNNKFFSMLYGQGNPGAVTTYNIQNGILNKLSNFQTETVQAFAPVNEDLLLAKLPRVINTAGSTLINYYQINTNSLLITKEGTLDAMAPANNGEIAHFSWIQQVGNKVFAPFFTIKNRNFHTDYPDQAWIAVYSYPEMTLEKTIKDNRTSFIGRYFTNGLGVVENGDTYAFSSSVAQNGAAITSTKPSAITRIKAGTTEFDLSYFFNIETASNGFVVTNWLYIGNNNFVVSLQPKAEKGAYTTGKTLGIVNVVNKTFEPVTGMPNLTDIKSITTNNYSPEDGQIGYIGVNLNDGTGYIYKINASDKTATKGLKVEGGVITAIQHLNN